MGFLDKVTTRAEQPTPREAPSLSTAPITDAAPQLVRPSPAAS